MQVKELGHLVLYVADLERSAAFYGDVLGWEAAFPATLGHPGRGVHLGADPPRAAAHRGRRGRRTVRRGAGSGCTTSV